MSEQQAADAGKPGGGVFIFAWKAVATTIGGGLLTLAVALAQMQYSNHLDRLKRQNEQGIVFQERILALTGQIETELNDIVDLLRSSVSKDQDTRIAALAEARRRFSANLIPLYQRWDTDRLLLRNRGAQIYGRAVALDIYDPADDTRKPDDCDVLAAADAVPPDECGPAMFAEATHLTASMILLRAHGAPLPEGTGPRGFEAASAIAGGLVDRYIRCRQWLGDPKAPSRCQHLAEGLIIAQRRVGLVGIARERLADAIMESSGVDG
jgi:hypothetical protein